MESTHPPRTKPSRGRQRIEIRRRENVEERRVTFTKRRTGLFEKAAELCVLCGAKIAILTFSEGRKAFCFGNPDIDSVLECYLRERSPAEIGLPSSGGAYGHTLGESKQLYLDALRGLEREKAERKSAASTAQTASGLDRGFWWEWSEEDGLGLEELEFYHDALEKMMKTVAAKIEGNDDNLNKNDVVNHGDVDILDTDNLIMSGLQKYGFD
ncbi:hypothetical protein SAY86_012489 [Trapa natans]|uniref:MADS-box domain-containing protein n=1 Tax=Trapa natans TaxID=22666 RepID=A0AAN7RAP0_TRANT|nr:hypothetical protein SAY86_012489 [Trapa natans]